MSKLDDKIADLGAEVSRVSSVVDSAVALIGGIAEQVKAAVDAALAAGATEAELAAITDLGASLEGKATELAAAVAANTPSA